MDEASYFRALALADGTKSLSRHLTADAVFVSQNKERKQ